MSTTARTNTPAPPARLKIVVWLKFGGLAALVLLALGASVGVGQSPSPKPSDDVLQLRVQSALDNDAELKPYRLTLLVNVVDRQVVIGGPVPNRAIVPRLEGVARAVPGIVGVKANVWVPGSLASDDPLGKKVAELMKHPAPTPAPPPVLNVPPPRADVPPPAAATPAVRPVSSQPAVVPPDPRPKGVVVVNKGPDGLLLDPVAPTGTGFRPIPVAPGAAPLPYSTIPPPNVPPVPPEAESVQPDFTPVDSPALAPMPAPDGLAALRADPRFAGLKVELQSGVAIISGRPVGGRAQGWALAQAVRKLPGVERVVVRQP